MKEEGFMAEFLLPTYILLLHNDQDSLKSELEKVCISSFKEKLTDHRENQWVCLMSRWLKERKKCFSD